MKSDEDILGYPRQGIMGADLEIGAGSMVISRDLAEQPPHIRKIVFTEWMDCLSQFMRVASEEENAYLEALEEQFGA